MTNAGTFIVLDGPEGCGKSTQVRLLTQKLAEQGAGALAVRDPGATSIGEKIRAILLDPDHTDMAMRCEMLLYMAARAQMMSQVILPELATGKIVVCDRFVSSTLAYQAGGEALSEREIRTVAQIAIQGRWPDLTILLDMPAEAAMARVRRPRDRIEQRPAEYHQRVRENYLRLAADDPAHYRVIAADRTPDQVHADVWQAVAALLAENRP